MYLYCKEKIDQSSAVITRAIFMCPGQAGLDWAGL